jgi:hypothetical protein
VNPSLLPLAGYLALDQACSPYRLPRSQNIRQNPTSTLFDQVHTIHLHYEITINRFTIKFVFLNMAIQYCRC